MKMKQIVSLVLATVLVFSSLGCSSERDEMFGEKGIKAGAFADLKSDLFKLNKTYENKETSSTRFKFKKWFRFLLVAVVDVACYVFEDHKCGTSVGGSSAANNLLTSIENGLTSDKKKTALKETALEGIEYGSTGFIHNQAIINMYEKYGDSLESFSTRELLDASMKEVSEITGCPYVRVSDETCALVDNAVAKLDPDKSIAENMCSLKTLTNDALKQEELEICGVILEGLQMVEDSDTTYYSSATLLIEQSELPASEKLVLQESLSIGYASAKLWNTDEPE